MMQTKEEQIPNIDPTIICKKVFQLSFSILLAIRDYLIYFRVYNPSDFQKQLEIEAFSSWRNLLNSNRVNFSELKRKLIFYNLNKICSIQYITSSRFRFTIDSSILDPSFQIGLNLSKSYHNNTITLLTEELLAPLQYKRVFRVDLHGQTNISNVHLFQNSCSLSLGKCQNINSIQELNKITFLDLQYCYNIQSLCSFQNIYELNLAGCLISDVSALSNAKKVNLSNCCNITDVSSLSNLHTLIVHKCHGIRDISRLGKLYRLDISGCRGIQDISQLGEVKYLNLTELPNIIFHLPVDNTVRYLRVSEDKLPILGSFSRKKKRLEIVISSPRPFDPEYLRGYHDIQIENGTFQNLNLFHHTLERLSLISCLQLKSISQFPCLTILSIDSCHGITTLNTFDFPQLICLTISNCWSIKELYLVGKHLKRVELNSDRWLQMIQVADNIKYLSISRCDSLQRFLIVRGLIEFLKSDSTCQAVIPK